MSVSLTTLEAALTPWFVQGTGPDMYAGVRRHTTGISLAVLDVSQK